MMSELLTWSSTPDGIYINTHPGGHMASLTERQLIARLATSEAERERLSRELEIANRIIKRHAGALAESLRDDLAAIAASPVSDTDREPQPSDGPDYWAEHRAWQRRQPGNCPWSGQPFATCGCHACSVPPDTDRQGDTERDSEGSGEG